MELYGKKNGDILVCPLGRGARALRPDQMKHFEIKNLVITFLSLILLLPSPLKEKTKHSTLKIIVVTTQFEKTGKGFKKTFVNGLNCVLPKLICWCANPQYLRMWQYLEIRSLRRLLMLNEVSGCGP